MAHLPERGEVERAMSRLWIRPAWMLTAGALAYVAATMVIGAVRSLAGGSPFGRFPAIPLDPTSAMLLLTILATLVVALTVDRGVVPDSAAPGSVGATNWYVTERGGMEAAQLLAMFACAVGVAAALSREAVPVSGALRAAVLATAYFVALLAERARVRNSAALDRSELGRSDIAQRLARLRTRRAQSAALRSGRRRWGAGEILAATTVIGGGAASLDVSLAATGHLRQGTAALLAGIVMDFGAAALAVVLGVLYCCAVLVAGAVRSSGRDRFFPAVASAVAAMFLVNLARIWFDPGVAAVGKIYVGLFVITVVGPILFMCARWLHPPRRDGKPAPGLLVRNLVCQFLDREIKRDQGRLAA